MYLWRSSTSHSDDTNVVTDLGYLADREGALARAEEVLPCLSSIALGGELSTRHSKISQVARIYKQKKVLTPGMCTSGPRTQASILRRDMGYRGQGVQIRRGSMYPGQGVYRLTSHLRGARGKVKEIIRRKVYDCGHVWISNPWTRG